jgi:hypothetical protein
MMTNGTVLETRWPSPACRNGAETISGSPFHVVRVDAVLVEAAGDDVHDLGAP